MEKNQVFSVSCWDTTNEKRESLLYANIEVQAEDSAMARRIADKKHGEQNLPHRRRYNIKEVAAK